MSPDTSGRRWGQATLALVFLGPALDGRLWAAPGDSVGAGVRPVSVQVDVAAVPGYDSDVNGVFEPGETVVAAPSWRALRPTFNLSGLAISFSGPIGGSYSVLDPTANYGTLGPGETKSCLDTGDCYLLSVPNYGARPLHWDATLTETIGVGVGVGVGATHDWTIHIGNSFSDVPSDNCYYLSVETLLHKGVIGGCGGGHYCPTHLTTRAQMAVFALASHDGPGYSPPACVPGAEWFGDVPATSPFCRWIEELARRELVFPDLLGNYRPEEHVWRGEMAYVVIALDAGPGGAPPPACIEGEPRMFDDVPWTHMYCPWIEELARRLDNLDPRILDGNFGGCTTTRFCPDDPPFRDETASFQVAGFDIKLHE
jgi:S-layer homology domain